MSWHNCCGNLQKQIHICKDYLQISPHHPKNWGILITHTQPSTYDERAMARGIPTSTLQLFSHQFTHQKTRTTNSHNPSSPNPNQRPPRNYASLSGALSLHTPKIHAPTIHTNINMPSLPNLSSTTPKLYSWFYDPHIQSTKKLNKYLIIQQSARGGWLACSFCYYQCYCYCC